MKLSALPESAFKAAGCSGKHAFESYNQAMKAMSHMEKAEVYRCDHCSKWHVSHRTKGPGRRKTSIPEVDLVDLEGRN